MKLQLGFFLLTALLLQGCGGGGSSGSNNSGNTSATLSSSVGTTSVSKSSSVSSSKSSSSSSGALIANAASFAMAPKQTGLFHFTWQDATGETEYRLLEQVSPAASFELVATLAANATSYDLAVSLVHKINASYQLQACLNNVCTLYQAVSVNGNLAAAVGYIKASNLNATDSFGAGIALSADGNTLAVGAIYEASNATGINGDQFNNNASDSGAVYVYTRKDFVWVQQAYVKASNTEEGDNFGFSVALSSDGNTLAVGAYGEDGNATGVNGDQTNNGGKDSGAVYMFARTGSVWVQQAYMKASNAESGDYFGYSIALSVDGNRLAVGAWGEDSNSTGLNGDQTNNNASGSGAAYMFTRTGSVWVQQAYVKASNAGSNDGFGGDISLSADGNTFAVGAAGESSNATGVNGEQTNNSARDSGAVYVFTRTGSIWVQEAYVKSSNTDRDDVFGAAIAISADGNTLAVGAHYEASNTTGVNGDQANNNLSGSGAAYVFIRTGSVWVQQAYVKASNPGFGDFFGSRMALSADGSRLAVGAYWESSNSAGVNGDQTNNGASSSGAVYVFTRTNSAWVQQAYVKAPNTESGDYFGYSIAFSADGNTLAVGAYAEDGMNGDQADNSALGSGAVYIY